MTDRLETPEDTSDDSSVGGPATDPQTHRGFSLNRAFARFEPDAQMWTLTHAGIDHEVTVRPVSGRPWKVALGWTIDGVPIGECFVSPWSPTGRKPSSHPQRRKWLRAGDFSFPKDTPTDVKTTAYAARRKMRGCTLSYGLGVTYWHVLDLDFTPPETGPNADPALHNIGVQLRPPPETAAARHVARRERHPTLSAFSPLFHAAVRIALMFLPALFAGLLMSFVLPLLRLPPWSLPWFNFTWPNIPWPPSWWPSFTWPSWWPAFAIPEFSIPIPEWLRRVVSFVMDNLRIILIAAGAIVLSRRYLRRNHARKKRREQPTGTPPNSSEPGTDSSLSRQETLTRLATALNNHKNQRQHQVASATWCC